MLNSLCKNKIAVIFFLLCSVSFGDASADASIDNLDKSRQQLAGVEERLEKTLADLARNETAETDILDELNLVDRQLSRLRRRVAVEKKSLENLNNAIAAETAALKNHKKEVGKLQLQVQQRLVAMYKSEQAGALKTLLSAQNLSRLLEDYDYMGRVVLHDRKLLDDFRARVLLQQASLARLAADKEKQQSVTADLRGEENKLQRTVRLKKRYLAAVRSDRTALDKMATDLKARAEQLTELVIDLEKGGNADAKKSVSLFELQKGFLPWPVKGGVKHPFGSYKHAELGSILDSHGIDIFSEPEIGVKAVWDGRIAFSKRFKGYGNLIIIDHENGYYSLYAQVHRLVKRTDDRVEKGELIAYTGFDGSDHVYFEIRKGRTPVDPLLWIEKR